LFFIGDMSLEENFVEKSFCFGGGVRDGFLLPVNVSLSLYSGDLIEGRSFALDGDGFKSELYGGAIG
jgi:hypothetical protein